MPFKSTIIQHFFNTYAWLFGRPFLVRFHKALLHLAARGLGIYNMGFHLSGESLLLRRLGTANIVDVVFDVGAHFGEYATEVRRNIPRCVVYSFEPHPRSFEELSTTAAKLRTYAYHFAVGADEGMVELFDFPLADGSSLATTVEAALRRHSKEIVAHSVPMTSLDSFAEQEDIRRIDLLKIDVEGGELEVLRGSTELLRSGAVKFVQFEFNEMNVPAHAFHRDFQEVMSNFHFYRMLPHGLIDLEPYDSFYCEIFAYQNILAVRRDLIDGIKKLGILS